MWDSISCSCVGSRGGGQLSLPCPAGFREEAPFSKRCLQDVSRSAIITPDRNMWPAVALVLLLSSAALGQAVPPVGGSTDHCGYTSTGSVSGGFASPAYCQPTLCCSPNGYCGPEPTITSDPSSAYCGPGCQATYGTCSPGVAVSRAPLLESGLA